METEKQPELTGLSTVTDITDVRRDERLRDEFSLVPETRRVYVLDAGEAKKKKGSADRMARLREKQMAAGLVQTTAPADVVARVKEVGGWPQFLALSGNVKEDSGSGVVPVQVEIREVIVEKIVEVEVIKEVFTEKIVEKEVPGPVRIEKVEVEKQVLRMTAEQKKSLYVGEKVRALTGFRRKIIKLLAGI